MCFTLPLWDPDFFLSWTLRSLRTMISVGFAESPWDAAAFSRMFLFFRQVRHVWMLECWTPRSWSSELWWENSCYCASCTWHKFARKEWKDAFLNFKDSLFEVLPGGSCLVRCREPFVGGASIATCLENNIDPNKDSRLRDAWRWWYELNWYHHVNHRMEKMDENICLVPNFAKLCLQKWILGSSVDICIILHTHPARL